MPRLWLRALPPFLFPALIMSSLAPTVKNVSQGQDCVAEETIAKTCQTTTPPSVMTVLQAKDCSSVCGEVLMFAFPRNSNATRSITVQTILMSLWQNVPNVLGIHQCSHVKDKER